jgi:RNA polymerase sigma-70 factor (ECF subfamily)
MYRVAWALCGSRFDAEDLVQDTIVQVLKRPRRLSHGNERVYLLRALRHTHVDHRRAASRRPSTRALIEDLPSPGDDSQISAREIMEALAAAPVPYRDAVIAVDMFGLSYAEAASALGTGEATITSRLYRGRAHVAQALTEAALV